MRLRGSRFKFPGPDRSSALFLGDTIVDYASAKVVAGNSRYPAPALLDHDVAVAPGAPITKFFPSLAHDAADLEQTAAAASAAYAKDTSPPVSGTAPKNELSATGALSPTLRRQFALVREINVNRST